MWARPPSDVCWFMIFIHHSYRYHWVFSTFINQIDLSCVHQLSYSLGAPHSKSICPHSVNNLPISNNTLPILLPQFWTERSLELLVEELPQNWKIIPDRFPKLGGFHIRKINSNLQEIRAIYYVYCSFSSQHLRKNRCVHNYLWSHVCIYHIPESSTLRWSNMAIGR